MDKLPPNITAVGYGVDSEARTRRFGHRGGVVWFTGLSGSGKSTLALALEARLFADGMNVFLLDGDNLRHGLTSDLLFSEQDRLENLRRIGEVAALFAKSGAIAITALISPYAESRARAREMARGAFLEVHLKTDLATCEDRDPKGLYAKARAGEILDFTGIDAPYEAPQNPDIALDTGALSVDQCIEKLADKVKKAFGSPDV